MPSHDLAQLNIAVMKEPLDSPRMADFVANLERINALAEQSPGYVWRLRDEHNDATSFRPLDAMTLVNMSTWRDVASLHDYVFKTAHIEIMRRRHEWFERMREAHTVLWWVPSGHRPSLAEALERLDHLRQHGPGERAFTFRQAFAPPDARAASLEFDDTCPAT